MQSAKEIFVFEERPEGAPLVEKIWRTRSEPFPSFVSVAATHWEMVVTRQHGQTILTVRGPETRATIASIPQDAEFFGIQLRIGAHMPCFPAEGLVDGSLTLPQAGGGFWLDGSAWQFPDYDNADVFVRKLAREGLLTRDPLVEEALQGTRENLSRRSVQRRILRATGLTQATIRQIKRAERAAALLEGGATILDAAWQTGYADQSHLSRSLKRFLGRSPKTFAKPS